MEEKKCILRHQLSDFTVTVTKNGVSGIDFGALNPQPIEKNSGFTVVGREALDRRERVHLDQLTDELTRYLNGESLTFEVETDLTACKDFQRRVLETTRQIPLGESRSYAWVAEHCGNPRGCRAVGQALKHNPIVIVIPCHRVIASDGGLGGFNGGLDWKRFLQQWEKKPS